MFLPFYNIFLKPKLNLLMKQVQKTTKKSITNIISLDIAQYNKKVTIINYLSSKGLINSILLGLRLAYISIKSEKCPCRLCKVYICNVGFIKEVDDEFFPFKKLLNAVVLAI